jgi:serine/threonine protein phosphatase PrpC
MLKFQGRTDVGLKRKHNEDTVLALEEYGLFVVADGVGGRNAGELASAMTVEVFQQLAPVLRRAVEAWVRNPRKETRNAVLEALDEAANTASRKVYEAANSTSRQGMTTTLVAALVGGGAAFLVHVGDSRAYLVRDGQLRQLTEDHSLVNQLIRTGVMSAEEAKETRYKNVITRAIGLYPSVETDTLHVDLVHGDRVLLCSDGLSDMVPPPELLRLLRRTDLAGSADALLAAALEGGGKDNISLITIDPEAMLEAEVVAARARALEKLFLFTDLPFQARLRVGRIASELEVGAGQVIVQQGEPGDTMFVVARGQVEVRVDGAVVAILGQGEHFGELTLIDEEPRSADIVASVPSLLVGIDRESLREFCLREPALGNQILWKLSASVARRLRAANQRNRGNTP